ncbi:hypothetical protein SDC9_136261 [bioreactor metagenome]|uniref:Uncharacterized protein n=1 Tax=bioreactor metagenome TaxID=1076179 RepID=A0A645DK04_9ZZZZ
MTVRPSSPGSNTDNSRGSPLMARCMVRMMSPRSPRARKVFSASAWTIQVPGCVSSARPSRCRCCRRPISSSRWRCSCGSLKRSICIWPSSPSSRLSVRSRLVHRSCSTSCRKVCWISSSVRGPSHSVASSDARCRKPSAM